MGGGDPPAQLHVDREGPAGGRANDPGASRPTTGGCAARRRSSGCGSRASPGWSRCCRRRTTSPPTTRASWCGRISPWPPPATCARRSWSCTGTSTPGCTGGERLLVHQEELGDRLMGVVAGYLLWSGRLPGGPQSIAVVERLVGHPMGPPGLDMVARAVGARRPRRHLTHFGTAGGRGVAGGGADRIEVRGLRAEGVHGVLPEEQDAAAAFRGRPRPVPRPLPGGLERRPRLDRRLRRRRRRRPGRHRRAAPSAPRDPGRRHRHAHPRRPRRRRGHRDRAQAPAPRHRPGRPRPACASTAAGCRPRPRCGPSSASGPTWETAGGTWPGPSTPCPAWWPCRGSTRPSPWVDPRARGRT